MDMTKFSKEELFNLLNNFIDSYIDLHNVNDMIVVLKDLGCTEEQLIALEFDQDDLAKVFHTRHTFIALKIEDGTIDTKSFDNKVEAEMFATFNLWTKVINEQGKTIWSSKKT